MIKEECLRKRCSTPFIIHKIDSKIESCPNMSTWHVYWNGMYTKKYPKIKSCIN